ncbi:MAG: leucine-rich repeat protein [Clostridia bacterium]|nr:leucine-rich repeat protein [Clostridia bacterium]
MKRFLCVFLSVCVVITTLVAGAVTVWAEENQTEPAGITWSFDEETGELRFEGEGAIPDYDDYMVDNELTLPWKDCAYTSIVFGEGITGIGNYAFCYSESLKSVEIPDTVTVLGKGIFYRCTSLESVKLPSEVTQIGENMFAACLSLKSVTLGAKTESIAAKAFYRCSALEEIVFPETLKTIGNSAFDMCTSLTSLVIPEGVTAIGSYAFNACEAVTEITLPSTLETIGSGAFNECISFKTITIPEKIATISSGLFYNCRVLESVTLPEGLVEIQENAFYLCPALKGITVPASVNVIGEKALGYSSRSLPVEGFTITGYANTAARLYADANGFDFVSLGYVLTGNCGETATWEYNEEEKTLYIGGSGAMEDFSSNPPALYNLIDYEKVVIGEEITRIGAYAFYGAAAMDFALSANITEIGEKAIGYYVDENGNEVLREGTSITAYEDTAAHAYATENGITFNPLAKPLVTNGFCGDEAGWTYDEETKTLTISGTGAIYDYTAENLPEYAEHEIDAIVIGDSITAIGDYAFYGVAAMDFALSLNIAEIGEKAIGYYVNENGEEVLREGTSITAYEDTAAHAYAVENSITFNSLGKFILTHGVCGDEAGWTYDEETKTLTISGVGAIYDYTAEILPEYAEYEIDSVVVPDGITAIGDYAFCTTNTYSSITIGKDVFSIGENAFGFTKEFLTDEEGNPTEEVVFIPNNELVVTGYIVTPADEYSREFEFIFEALDGDTYIDFSFNFPTVTDHINKFIVSYPNDASTQEITANVADPEIEVTCPEKLATNTVITFTKGESVSEYKFVVLGDVNCDGKQNSTDALTILQHSVQMAIIEDVCQLKAGDVNGDGKINSTDALILLQISVSKVYVTDFYDPGLIR